MTTDATGERKRPMATAAQKKPVQQEGSSSKTLFDRIQLLVQVIGAFAIPISIFSLFLSVLLFNEQQRFSSQQTLKQQQHDTQQALDQQQQTTLETYLDRMSDLLLANKLRESKPGDVVRSVAIARTSVALENLNSTRKAIVVLFLYQSGLILKPQSAHETQNPIVILVFANLSGASLHLANLNEVDLHSTNLSGADLSIAYLEDANLSGINLENANLNGAYLADTDLGNAYLHNAHLRGDEMIGTNLQDANLSGADLSGSEMHGANLNGANLEGANLNGVSIDPEQLKQAFSLKGAIMPDGTKHP